MSTTAVPDRFTTGVQGGHNDLQVPGVLRGQAAQLDPGRRVAGLAHFSLLCKGCSDIPGS